MRLWKALIFFALPLLASSANCQDSSTSGPAAEINPKPYGAYSSLGPDTINLDNGKPIINIPLFSYPQRGGILSLGYHLQFSSQLWEASLGSSVALSGFSIAGDLSAAVAGDDEGNFTVQDENGSHLMARFATDPTKYIAYDGSGYQLTTTYAPSEVIPPVTDRHGTTVFWGGFNVAAMSDINGNQITANETYYPDGTSIPPQNFTGWTDTLGRVIPIFGEADNDHVWNWPASYNAATGLKTSLWTVPGLAGGSATYTFNWQESGFANGPCVDYGYTYCDPNSGSGFDSYGLHEGRLASLVYPDGTAWHFGYDLATNPSDPAHYGDLNRIETPQGAVITYVWAATPSIVPLCNTGAGYPRTVKSRTLSVNGSFTQTWHYDLLPVNSGTGSVSVTGVTPTGAAGTPYAMRVTDPGGNQTTHVFESLDVTGCAYFETHTIVYDAQSATVVSTVKTTYATNSGNYKHGGLAVWPAKIETGLLTQEFTPTFGPSLGSGENVYLGLNGVTTRTDMRTSEVVETDTHYWWESALHMQYLYDSLIDLPTERTSYSVNPATGIKTMITDSWVRYDEPNTLWASGVNTQHTSVPEPRGLPTSSGVWRNTDNAYIQNTQIWYDTGMPAETIDGAGNISEQISYNATYAGAYPTATSDVFGHATQMTYDFTTGLVSTAADPNMLAKGQWISYTYYPLSAGSQAGHLQNISYPNGENITYTYPDVNTIQTQTLVSPGVTLTSQIKKDGLNRIIDRVQFVPTSICGSGAVHQDTSYDFAGRVGDRELPTCGIGGMDDEQFGYDAIGRILYDVWGHQRAGKTFTYPTLYSQLETNNDGFSTFRIFDGLGRITTVFEPIWDQDQNPETDYQYDALGNLIDVHQFDYEQNSGVERRFSYNSLSQIVTATNPESGTMSYTYDSSGNLATSTDARGYTNRYCYDAGYRLITESTRDTTCTGTSGSPNPDVSVSYDGVSGGGPSANQLGRISKVQSFLPTGSLASSEVYSYNLMGQPTLITESLASEIAGNQSHATQFSYDFAGNISQIQYPSGRQVAYGRPAGWLTSVQDVTGGASGVQYLSAMTVWPDGTPHTYEMANSAFTITALEDQDARVYDVTTAKSTGTIQHIGYNFGDYHLHRLDSISNLLHTNPSYYTSYTYDELNRLKTYSQVNSAGMWAQNYSYDAAGNLTQSMPSIPGLNVIPSPQVTYDPATNRALLIPGQCEASPLTPSSDIDPTNGAYDKSGNRLCTGVAGSSQQYLYDGMGRLQALASGSTLSAQYTYSGEGNRVRKDLPTGFYQEYVWAGGEVLEERVAAGTTDYIYANGQKIARVASQKPVFKFQGSRSYATNTMACGLQGYLGNIGTALSAIGAIQPGDHLSFDQRIPPTDTGTYANGSIALFSGGGGFSALSPSVETVTDGEWHHLDEDLGASFSGTTIDAIGAYIHNSTGEGDWEIDYDNILYSRADGTIVPLFNGSSLYVYTDGGGTIMSPYGGCGSYTFQASLATVPVDTAQGASYFLADQLGTTQMELGSSGNILWQGTFSPFGQELNPQTSSMNYKFTGKERDAESGHDYFGARYLASTAGRWTSPDPSGLSFANLGNPQSLNLYAYVRNSPTQLRDPNGLCTADGPTCSEEGAQDGHNEEDSTSDLWSLLGEGVKGLESAFAGFYNNPGSSSTDDQYIDWGPEAGALDLNGSDIIGGDSLDGLGYWQNSYALFGKNLGAVGFADREQDYILKKANGDITYKQYYISEVIDKKLTDVPWPGLGYTSTSPIAGSFKDSIGYPLTWKPQNLYVQQYFVMSGQPGIAPSNFVRVPISDNGKLFYAAELHMWPNHAVTIRLIGK